MKFIVLFNTTDDIEKIAKQVGLEVNQLELIEGRPEYLRMSAITYIPGYLYEKLVNSSTYMDRYRILLVVELRKPSLICFICLRK